MLLEDARSVAPGRKGLSRLPEVHRQATGADRAATQREGGRGADESGSGSHLHLLPHRVARRLPGSRRGARPEGDRRGQGRPRPQSPGAAPAAGRLGAGQPRRKPQALRRPFRTAKGFNSGSDARRPPGRRSAGRRREDFLKLSAEDKDAVLEKLDLATEFARSAHADWLRDALRRLRQRVKGEGDDLGVGDVLIACSEDADDPYLRELSAFAMNFWRGDEAANARMEKRLVDLTYDDGQGQEASSELTEQKDESRDRRPLQPQAAFRSNTTPPWRWPGSAARTPASTCSKICWTRTV